MSRVSVRLFAGAAEAFGSSETEVDGPATLADLVATLTESGDERLREVIGRCSFFVDGEHRIAMDTPLRDGSRVDVLPPFAGG